MTLRARHVLGGSVSSYYQRCQHIDSSASNIEISTERQTFILCGQVMRQLTEGFFVQFRNTHVETLGFRSPADAWVRNTFFRTFRPSQGYHHHRVVPFLGAIDRRRVIR